MAKKKSKKAIKASNKKKMVITKDDLHRMDKTAHRNALKEEGLLQIPTHKVHKSPKDYTRKPKHTKKIDPDDETLK